MLIIYIVIILLHVSLLGNLFLHQCSCKSSLALLIQFNSIWPCKLINIRKNKNIISLQVRLPLHHCLFRQLLEHGNLSHERPISPEEQWFVNGCFSVPPGTNKLLAEISHPRGFLISSLMQYNKQRSTAIAGLLYWPTRELTNILKLLNNSSNLNKGNHAVTSSRDGVWISDLN